MRIAFLEWMLDEISHTAWQNFTTTAILVPVVLLLCRMFHRRPAVQHLLWLLLLVKFLTPQVPGFAWNIPVERVVSRISQLQSSEKAALAPLASDEPGRNLLPAESSVNEIQPTVAATTTPYPTPEAKPARSFFQAVKRVTVLIWALGAFRLLAIYFGSLRRQLWILRRATPANKELAEIVNDVAARVGVHRLTTILSSDTTTPFISCVGNIRLVWPTCLEATNPQSLRSLIAHEAAHIRRYDHAVAWMELIATIVWWWNPILWFVRRQLRCTAEMACDAMALEVFPDDRCFYAEKLLELSLNSPTGSAPLALAVGGGATTSLERRIAMIVTERVCGKLGLIGFVVAMAVAVCSMPGWALTQTVEDERIAGTEPARVPASSPQAQAPHAPHKTSDAPRSQPGQVTLSDGAVVPLDSEGMAVPRLLGERYIVGWNRPLTIAEFGEPIRVRLSETPLMLDLRTGEGIRQALIRIRAIRGTADVQLQLVRAAGIDPLRLDVRTVQISDSNGRPNESPAKLTLLTPIADIETVSLEGAISIRKIAISEGRTVDSSTTAGAIKSNMRKDSKAP